MANYDHLKGLTPDQARTELKAIPTGDRTSYESPWGSGSGLNAWITDLSSRSSAETAAASATAGAGGPEGTVIIDRIGKRTKTVMAPVGTNLYMMLEDNGIETGNREVSLIDADLNSVAASTSTLVHEGRQRVVVGQRVEGGC